MEIFRWDPFTAMARMDKEFDELVRRTWGGAKPGANAARGTSSGFVPPVDIVHRGEDIQVRLELPGINPHEDVQVLVEDGRLIITGERRETTEKSDGLLVRELRYGAFRREFALPEGITAEDVQASYDAGLLEVLVRGVVKPVPEPQRVPIQVGAGEGEQVSIES